MSSRSFTSNSATMASLSPVKEKDKQRYQTIFFKKKIIKCFSSKLIPKNVSLNGVPAFPPSKLLRLLFPATNGKYYTKCKEFIFRNV